MTAPYRRTFTQLIRTEILLWNHCDAELKRQLGLPLTHLEGLRVIEQTQPCRVQEVAARLLITVGAASKLVDRLEAAGHCKRTANFDDRRSSLLELTRDGQKVLAQTEKLIEPLLLQAFSITNIQSLNDALTQVEQAILGATK